MTYDNKLTPDPLQKGSIITTLEILNKYLRMTLTYYSKRPPPKCTLLPSIKNLQKALDQVNGCAFQKLDSAFRRSN